MFKLIKNVELYQPKNLGKKDILICNDKIIKIGENLSYEDIEVIEGDLIAIPGIIDPHVHITGGGGEGGFHTRTPEVKLSDLIKSGITTVVGLLGTDSLTRSVENLLAKTKALNTEGITAYCLTGAYKHPSPTLTGEVGKDIAFINEVLGVKLAISDHREPMITKDELMKLASEVRVSGMISGKMAFITLHMGDHTKRLSMVHDILIETSIPITHFRPTHVNRNQDLFLDSLLFLEKGGFIDLTVGNDLPLLKEHLNIIKSKKLPLQLVTISSDGNGSWSKYDDEGKLIQIGVQKCDGILNSMKYLIEQAFPIEEVIALGTSNVARSLNLSQKGQIIEGRDADILLLDKQFNLKYVISKGNILMNNGEITQWGTFE